MNILDRQGGAASMALVLRTSALVAIDLQNGVPGRDTRPRPASKVLASARIRPGLARFSLATAFALAFAER